MPTLHLFNLKSGILHGDMPSSSYSRNSVPAPNRDESSPRESGDGHDQDDGGGNRHGVEFVPERTLSEELYGSSPPVASLKKRAAVSEGPSDAIKRKKKRVTIPIHGTRVDAVEDTTTADGETLYSLPGPSSATSIGTDQDPPIPAPAEPSLFVTPAVAARSTAVATLQVAPRIDVKPGSSAAAPFLVDEPSRPAQPTPHLPTIAPAIPRLPLPTSAPLPAPAPRAAGEAIPEDPEDPAGLTLSEKNITAIIKNIGLWEARQPKLSKSIMGWLKTHVLPAKLNEKSRNDRDLGDR